MNYQPDSDVSWFWDKAKQHIYRNWENAVQRMETDATSPWIINWIPQKMIDVHEDSGDHHQISYFPIPPEENADNNRRDKKM